MSEFKIILPEAEIDVKRVEQENRAFFKVDDANRMFIHSKVLIFAYIHQPTTVSELMDKMGKYYKQQFDKATLHRVLKNLADRGLVFMTPLSYAINSNSEMNLKIKNKYHEWLLRIPEQFRMKFRNINYYHISESGSKYIQWCCEILKFKCE